MLSTDIVTILLLAVLALSALRGALMGTRRTAAGLGTMFGRLLLRLLGVLAALLLAGWTSPYVQDWADRTVLAMPAGELPRWTEAGYTLLGFVSDFPLLRIALLFLLIYPVCLTALSLLGRWRSSAAEPAKKKSKRRRSNAALDRLGGAGLGLVAGIWRSLLLLALLFVFVSLRPDSPVGRYAEASPAYRYTAQNVFAPAAGDWLRSRLPVLTEAASSELENIIRQKYDVIDRDIPADIGQAAKKVTQDGGTDIDKAKLLYRWVGTRIQYDYDKVSDYENKGIWHEQTPRDTYDTRRGVCIDYARLYAVMARSAGLQVRVVTGLGADGKGGYGSHAWNEVYAPEEDRWISLDPTWAAGGDWFDRDDFADTHIKQSVL
ncbi:transglutaminase-like domain-containing protein [Saccharibacillus sp. CPCC 101409]|uniref:transglutaminase domain-containing protein n=1 Tax=Saccharibacillus sp. CPCC 101409 TaxID=3058041 RepID=UPI002673D5E3|nr:transglutaminase-like domain-containing protein [Saccharibacillus sp. CPCC 101409]MDO3410998.1 transglutaminase-like domain-containing protein [Saccharibacillus sp. CPCC 101409]